IMIMPILEKNIIKRIENYKKIYTVFKNLQKKYISIDTLSLGTSFDLEEALIANSNMIRIGRSIFK
ncbi:MAG: YggS family pyridoxal phosphate enzyme, partial [Buchnera aphidicola]|nr:YggS family pyridoxal phosphate enzyme [Buchnera aphidicola]